MFDGFDNLDSWVKSDYVKVDRRKAPWGARAHQGKIKFPFLAAAFRCISKIGRRLWGMENRVGSKLGITVQAGRQGSLVCKGAGFHVNPEAEYVSRGDGRSIHLDACTSLDIEPESSRNLKWHLDQATSLRDFAALCFGAPLPLQSISFWGGKISISETIQIPEVVRAYFFEQTPSTPSPPRLSGAAISPGRSSRRAKSRSMGSCTFICRCYALADFNGLEAVWFFT